MGLSKPRCLGLVAASIFVAQAALAATPVREAYDGIEDGRLRFEFPTREGVWGDGESIRSGHHDRDWNCERDEGPGRIQLSLRDGELRRAEFRVGGRWRPAREPVVDLGLVDPSTAVDFLLDLAASGAGGDREDLVFAATTVEGFEDWNRIVSLARDRDVDSEVREQAVFWLGQAAAEEATQGLIRLLEDDDEELELREHAVFALSQQSTDQVIEILTRVARKNRHPQLREQAFFWLAQHDDPRVVDFFEEVLLQD